MFLPSYSGTTSWAACADGMGCHTVDIMRPAYIKLWNSSLSVSLWDWSSLRCFIPRCNHQDKHLYQGSKVEQSFKVANRDLAYMLCINKVCFCNHDYCTSTLSVNSWIGLVSFVDMPFAIWEPCWEIQKTMTSRYSDMNQCSWHLSHLQMLLWMGSFVSRHCGLKNRNQSCPGQKSFCKAMLVDSAFESRKWVCNFQL